MISNPFSGAYENRDGEMVPLRVRDKHHRDNEWMLWSEHIASQNSLRETYAAENQHIRESMARDHKAELEKQEILANRAIRAAERLTVLSVINEIRRMQQGEPTLDPLETLVTQLHKRLKDGSQG